MTDHPLARAPPAALWLLALLALSGPAMPLAAERYEGIAYSHGTDRIVYRETHWLFDRDGTQQRLVIYRCADGTPFGRKWVGAAPSATAPDFDYEDARDGYREGVRTEKNARLVFVSHDREFVGGLATRILELKPGGKLVDFKGTYDEYLKAQGLDG